MVQQADRTTGSTSIISPANNVISDELSRKITPGKSKRCAY